MGRDPTLPDQAASKSPAQSTALQKAGAGSYNLHFFTSGDFNHLMSMGTLCVKTGMPSPPTLSSSRVPP